LYCWKDFSKVRLQRF